jgi:hypothetical protein
MDLANEFDRKLRIAEPPIVHHSGTRLGRRPSEAKTQGGSMKLMGRSITLLAVTVLLVSAAFAQYAPMSLKIDVPFEFNVAKQAFPAGQYFIVRMAPRTLALRDSQYRFLTAIVAGDAQTLTARAKPGLKFQVVNGRHVLAEIWPAGTKIGYQLYVPKAAVAFAKDSNSGTQVAVDAQSSAAPTRQ